MMDGPASRVRTRNYRLILLSVILLVCIVSIFSIVMAQSATLTAVFWNGYNHAVQGNIPAPGTYWFTFSGPVNIPASEDFSGSGGFTLEFGALPEPLPGTCTTLYAQITSPVTSNTVSCAVNSEGYCAPDPDGDGDGVANCVDDCPGEKGSQPNGCPIPSPTDGDGDGVPDHLDRCPAEHGPIELNGCPDKDDDGVPDIDDDCDDEKGPKSNNGCPVTPVPGDEDTPTPPLATQLPCCPPIPTPTPTPDEVTRFDPTAPCNLAPRPNARGARINVYPVMGGGDSVIGQITQSGQGSGPFKVLSISADGQWYQIGKSLHSAEFWGWVPADEIQAGGLDCDKISPAGLITPTATPMPDKRVVNAEKLEVLVNGSIDILLSECASRAPEYLEFLSDMITVDRSEAERIAQSVKTSPNACEAISSLLDETSGQVTKSSVVSCLQSATPDKVNLILLWADKLQLHDQQFTDVCQRVIKKLALLGDIEDSKVAFYEKLRQPCGYSTESALSLLEAAMKNNIDLARVVEDPQFCVKAFELVQGTKYQKKRPEEIPPQLSTCDPSRTALFLDELSRSPFLQENLERFLNSSDPCTAIKRWLLYGELPVIVPIVDPLTPPPGPTTPTPTPVQGITPTQEILPTQVVQIILPDATTVSINSLDWMAEDQDSGYLGVFVAPSEDGKSTDLYTFKRGAELTALHLNSPENEQSPAISVAGSIAYIIDGPDGLNRIEYVKDNQEKVTIQLPEGWRIEAPYLELVWDQEGKLYFTLINTQSQSPAIWRSDSGPVEMMIDGATSPFIVNGQLVVKVVNPSAEVYGYVATEDLPRNVDELSLYQPPAGLGQCSEMTAYKKNDVMMVCNGAIVIAPLQNGSETRAFHTGQTSIFNLSLVPATESYITWDDGNRIYRCKLSAGECTRIEFSVSNAAPVTSLDWR